MGLFYVFAIGLMFADIACSLQRTRKHLFKVLNCNFAKIQFKDWLKMMSCLERVSSHGKKVGLTCLSLFTVTYTSVLQVTKFPFFTFCINIESTFMYPTCTSLTGWN